MRVLFIKKFYTNSLKSKFCLETPPTKILGKERGLAVAKEGKADTETLDTNGIFAINVKERLELDGSPSLR